MYFSETKALTPIRNSALSPDVIDDNDSDDENDNDNDNDNDNENDEEGGRNSSPESRKNSASSNVPIPDSVRSDSVTKKVTKTNKNVKQKTIPTTGMLTLSFRSKVERELFSNYLHLCNPSIDFASDCQMLEGKDTVRFKCSTLNAIGMSSETVLLINCKKSKIWFGEDEDSPCASIEDIVCTPSLTNNKRMDIQFPTSETSVGSRILQSHDESTERKMTTISLLFASASLRERFLGRIRALSMGFKGIDPQETLSLPSGESLLICTASWNLGDKGPPDDLDKLETWIPAGSHDIYAVGFQECAFKKKWFKALQDYLCGESARVKLKNRLQADSKMEAMASGTTSKTSSNIPKSSYVLLSIQSLWSIHLVIICRSDLKNRIKHLTSSTEATGIAHVLGNKGGVATGFVIDNTTSLAFVTSHLAARVTRLHTRQENYEEIVNGLHLGGMAHGTQPVKSMDFLHSFDHVFWFGDLNYRIDMGSHGTPKEYKRCVKLATDPDERYQLQDFDQLRKQMKGKSVMCDFEEGAIDFAPTYRMIKNGEGYSNKKYQNPSYCDRVLWRSLPGSAPQIYQTLYASAPKLNSSDHRPVCANFHMNVREPFIARGPIVADGGKNGPDLVIISVYDLKFTVVPETAHEKAKRAYKFDGYSGPAVCTFESLAFAEGYCSAPAKIKERKAAKNFKKMSSNVSESEATDDKVGGKVPAKLELPEWEWDNRDILDMFPFVSDCEWLGTQNIACIIRKGSHADAPILGQCEIPLSGAFADLIEETRGETDADEEIGIGEEDNDINDDDDFFGSRPSVTGTNFTRALSTRASQVQEDNEKNKLYVGAPFKSHMLIHGKYIGNLTGRILMKNIAGISADEDDVEISEKLVTLKQTLLGLRKKRVERIAVATESPKEEESIKIKVADQQHKAEKKVEKCEVTDDVVGVEVLEVEKGGESEDVGEGDVRKESLETSQAQASPPRVVEPTLLRIGGKAKVLGDGNESDNSDDDDDDNEDGEDEGPEVWMEGDEVVSRWGKRWARDDFVCQITGQNLVEDIFIMKDGNPFSKGGYLEMFGKDDLCAHCLKEAKKTDDVLLALDFKWHANHLKCSHTGNNLPRDENILVKDKLPYNEKAYEELFHTCPRCLDVVPLNSDLETGVKALNQVWHKDCFNCDTCGCEFEDGHFYKHDNKNDGRGMMPYCENCFKINFMPRCAACKDYILTPTEDSVEACGGVFHIGCFRCAATGEKIEGGYITHDDLPFSPEAYFEKFGEKCTKCGLVMKEKIVNVLGQKWHPECFTCTSSGVPIPTNEAGEYIYYEHDLMPYCAAEFSRLFGETCTKCNKPISMDESLQVWLDEKYHSECLTCASCKKYLVDMQDGKICQGPEDGQPYCSKCYGRKFGEVCAACKFPLNPGEVPVEALGKIWHKKHFCCVKCRVSLFKVDESGEEVNAFFPHEGLPFCEDCYVQHLCEYCGGCGGSIKPGEEKLTLQDGSGGQSTYHRSCHKCFINGTPFGPDDAIYMHDGNPFCEEAYVLAFADYQCSGCGEGIAGARQMALDKSWHPGCINCANCGCKMKNEEIFIREEKGPGMNGGKWPVCQKHMMCKFDDLEIICQKKLKGEEWSTWGSRKAVALEKLRVASEERRSLLEIVKKERLSSASGLETILRDPFKGVEEEMRAELGIRGSKTRAKSDLSVPSVSGASKEVWVVLKDVDGYEYFWNKSTDETSYEKPDESFAIIVQEGAANGAIAEGALASEHLDESEEDKTKSFVDENGHNWIIRVDTAVGQHFYENLTLNSTQWEDPREKGASSGGGGGEGEGVKEGGGGRSHVDSCWSLMTDDQGQQYYENTITRRTQWERPEGFIPEGDEREESVCGEREEKLTTIVDDLCEEEKEAEDEVMPDPVPTTKPSSPPKYIEDEESSAPPPPPPTLPPPATELPPTSPQTPPSPPITLPQTPLMVEKMSSITFAESLETFATGEEADSEVTHEPGKGMKGVEDEDEDEDQNNDKDEGDKNMQPFNITNSSNWSNEISTTNSHKSGYLKKKGGGTSLLGRRNWNLRYFVLNHNRLSYWKTEDDYQSNAKPLGTIPMLNCVLTRLDKDKYDYGFKITSIDPKSAQINKRELMVCANNEADMGNWMNVIKLSSHCDAKRQSVNL